MKTRHEAVVIFRRMIEALVAHPDRLELAKVEAGSKVFLSLRADRSDTPKLIGERGRNFRALSEIASKMGTGCNHPAQFVLAPVRDAIVGTPGPTPYVAGSGRETDVIVALLKECLEACGWCNSASRNRIDIASGGEVEITCVTIRCYDTGDQTLAEAVRTIFDAIGKANGRQFFIEIDLPPAEEPQPARADGRFAKEGN